MCRDRASDQFDGSCDCVVMLMATVTIWASGASVIAIVVRFTGTLPSSTCVEILILIGGDSFDDDHSDNLPGHSDYLFWLLCVCVCVRVRVVL